LGHGWNVGNKHIWQRIEAGLVTRAAGDGDGSTVHIHFWGTGELGEPSPCKRCFAVWNFFWEFKVEGGGTVDTGAASFDGFDDLEFAVFGWFTVKCYSELTRATAMDCGALERESLLLADGHLVLCRHGEAELLLARELSARNGRVIDLIDRIRNWTGHDHVCIDSGSQ
jgi:hypothetical protein